MLTHLSSFEQKYQRSIDQELQPNLWQEGRLDSRFANAVAEPRAVQGPAITLCGEPVDECGAWNDGSIHDTRGKTSFPFQKLAIQL